MVTTEEWDQQEKMDPENAYQHRLLYIIWNEKANFLLNAANENYFNSEYFLWCDIGAVRHKVRERNIHLETYPQKGFHVGK